MDKAAAVERILGCGVIAIVRASSAAGLVEAAKAIVEGGIAAIEFTLTTPDARRLIHATREQLGSRALVGAGTVLNGEQAREAVAAGAEFIVMPILDRGAVEAAQRAGVPVIPGAFTPTEILTAWNWGADLVKWFPASLGGPAYVKALCGPLPQLRLIPTGGVDATNAADYVRAGAAAVAVGGHLVDRRAIEAKEFHRLTASAQHLVEVVRRARAEKRP